MTPLARGFLLLALYLVPVLLVAAAARWVKPRIPRLLLGVLALLPFVFLGGGVFRDETLLPVDHALLMPPWNTHPEVRRYNPYLNDIATQFLPWAKAMRIAWAEGSAPWRDRWNGCGTPLAANGASAAFSPLTLLAAPLPLPSAFLLVAALKIFLALSGMWLWLRALDVSSGAAFFGSVSFAFSFAMVPWLFAPQSGVVCLWPWLLFALERLRDQEAARRAFWLLVALFALLPLSGHAESAACGALFAGLWLVLRWLLRDLPEMLRVASRVAAAALLAFSLTAFALFPQVLAILSSNRIVLAGTPFWSAFLSWRPHGPSWSGALYTTFLPRALGDGITTPLVPGAPASFIEMALGYAGILGWGCAALVVRPGSRRRRTTWALLLLAAAALGTATATWPFLEIVGRMPLFRFIFPVRFLPCVAFSAAALAALELDRLREDLKAGWKAGGNAIWVVVLLMIWVAMVSERVRPLHASNAIVFQREALLVAEVALGVSAFVVLLATFRRGRWAPALPYALAAVCGGELWMQGARLYRYGRDTDLFPSTPLVEFLGKQAAPFRVVGDDGVLFPNTNVFAGVEEVRTHDPVERRDYVEFLNATCGFPPAEYFKFLGDLNAPALDFLNVRYLISFSGRESPGPKWRGVYSEPDGTVFENRDVLPRVFAPEKVTFAASARSEKPWTRHAFDEFGTPASAFSGKKDWREHALLLGTEAKTIVNGRADVSGYRESTNGASFRARVWSAEAILVTSLVQDGGWSASDENGRAVFLTRANGPFLALRLPAGDHRILLKYRPSGFIAGFWTSLAGLASALLWAGVGLRRRDEAAG